MDKSNLDRPLECTECKRPVKIRYSEICDGQITESGMCNVCPVLQKKLHGEMPETTKTETTQATGLACGTCGTTLESVRTGNPLGCPECYEVFSDVIGFELGSTSRLSRRLGTAPSKSAPLHLGRGPGETSKIDPHVKLVALDEALEATLKGEDYEGAAWLRDQIKAAKEHINES